jgi:hypothetical protein
MAASQPVAGVEVEAGAGEKAKAKHDEDDIAHRLNPGKISG